MGELALAVTTGAAELNWLPSDCGTVGKSSVANGPLGRLGVPPDLPLGAGTTLDLPGCAEGAAGIGSVENPSVEYG